MPMNQASRRRPALVLAGVLASAACAAAPAGDTALPPYPSSAADWPSSAPDWQGQPLSWDKLDRIDDWLTGAGPDDWPAYVPEAELQLAEGRLDLARRDEGALSAARLDARILAAEAGFRRVLSDPDLSPHQRRRAERGLAAAQELRTPPPPDRAGLNILARTGWSATPPVAARLTRNLRSWTRITVHHSAMPSGELRTGSPASVADAIRRIQLVHMRDEGWGDIGYHFLIDPAGRVYQGRILAYQGAHAGGANNVGNIGICLLGDFDHEQPTERALDSLEELIVALSRRHGIARASVKGHREFKATQCPGRNLTAWVRRYAG